MNNLHFLKILIAFSLFVSIISTTKEDTNKAILNTFINGPAKTVFKVWHFLFDKEYDYNTKFGIERYIIFKKNLKAIQEHNQKNLSYSKGLNHLSDLTREEIIKKYNLSIKSRIKFLEEVENNNFVQKGYKDVNWKDKMTSVKAQDYCDSGWAFAAVATVEGIYNIKSKKSINSLSNQQLVDCDRGSDGCSGGSIKNAYNYLKSNYLMFESDYRYKGEQGGCNYNVSRTSEIRVKNYDEEKKENKIYELLSKGPVAVSINADSDFFNYSGGIFTGRCGNCAFNHYVTLVGFTNDKGDEYWTVKNSWHTSWGENGYMRVKRESDSCGISKYGVQPEIEY